MIGLDFALCLALLLLVLWALAFFARIGTRHHPKGHPARFDAGFFMFLAAIMTGTVAAALIFAYFHGGV